jgi:hypothetical protein
MELLWEWTAPTADIQEPANADGKDADADLDFVQDQLTPGTEWSDLVLVEDLDLGLDPVEVLVERRGEGILSAVVFEQSKFLVGIFVGSLTGLLVGLLVGTRGPLVGSRVGRLVGTRVAEMSALAG